MGCGSSTEVRTSDEVQLNNTQGVGHQGQNQHRQRQNPQPYPAHNQQQRLPPHQQQTQQMQQPHGDSHPPAAVGMKPGMKPDGPITIYQVYDHNRYLNNHGFLWFPWRGFVYDVKNIEKALISGQGFEQLPREMRYPSEPYPALVNVMYTLESLRLLIPPGKRRRTEGEEADGEEKEHPVAVSIVSKNRIAKLEVLTPGDRIEYYRKQLDEYKRLYENQADRPSQHFLTVINRNYKILHSKFSSPPKGDPNKHDFPLPPDVSPQDCSELRMFAFTTAFDNDIGPISGYPGEPEWQWQQANERDIHEEFAKHVSQSHGDEPFNTGIPDGAVAWEEIEVDLLKNEVVLVSQEEVWKLRYARSDLDDPDRMKRRRDKLLALFMDRYKFSDDRMEPYRVWARHMEESWDKFEKLCE